MYLELVGDNDIILSYAQDVEGAFSIPPFVTIIGYEAFRGSKITKVHIPSSVKITHGSVFSDCQLLEDVSIEAGLLQIV